MTYPGKQENRPEWSGSLIALPNAEIEGTADCIACLGRNAPMFVERYDNHPPLGPICLACVGRLINDRKWRTGRGRCDGCCDTGRVRYLGGARFCTAYCVPRLRAMPTREVTR